MRRIIVRINRHVPVWCRKKKITAKALELLYSLLILVDDDFKVQMKTALQMYNTDAMNQRALYKDMLREFVRSWICPVEYAKFELLEKSRKERDTYIPDYEEVNIFKRTPGNNTLPDSKYERYLMFKQFFQRQILAVSSISTPSEDDYNAFLAGKESVVVKPMKGTKGHGVTVISTNKIKTLFDFRTLFDGDYLIEEMIQQGEELKQFHPNSVNTIRFVTGINHSGEFFHLFSLFRIGRGSNVVDNVSNGGLVALIDMESGKICAPACCGTERFEAHPDTEIRFQGFAVPEWNKLRSLVREMHLEHPHQRLFGFDIAWTKSGWDLVEVNPAPSFDSYQELTGEGIRPYLQRIGML